MLTDARLSRRVVLGAGVGTAAAAVVGLPESAQAAETDRAPEIGNRHIAFTSWTGPELLRGDHQGTTWRPDGLRIGRATATRAYVDPFGTGTAVSYEQASWLSPRVPTRFGLQELIASWNVETPGKTWVEILVRGHDETGTLSGWYVLGRWSAKDPDDGGAIHRTSVDGQKTPLATVYTDTFHAYDPHRLSDYQLQVNLLRTAGSRDTPVVRMIGAMASNLPDDATVPVSPVGRGAGQVLDVPPFSQEIHVGHYPQWDNGGEAWCSATSTAMVLKYWRTGPRGGDLAWVTPPVDAEVDVAARNVFDYTYDGAGNWPFNTAYAAGYGLEGFVTRLRSFTEAEDFIRAGIPLIISVSFEKDELDGAGYGTNGHLMVVAGFTKTGDVVVNDPASHLLKDDGQVRTTYRRDQLENAWIPHSGGTVYLIHPRSRRLPHPPSEANW
jgi:hypothetical protein